jgi:hypothetical protein
MLSLILYELRSRWSGIVILLSVFFIWDFLLVWGLADLDVLALTLLYLSSIGYLIILVGVNVFLFNMDFFTHHVFFISTTPSKFWEILLSKLIPIWITSIILYFVHSVFLILTYIRITDRTNAANSLLSFCSRLFQTNCFLILLITVSLLFFWIVLLLVRMHIQNTKSIWIWIVIVLAGGSTMLLYCLLTYFIKGFTSQNIMDWHFSILKPLTYLILLFLSFLLFWITQDLLRKHIDQ